MRIMMITGSLALLTGCMHMTAKGEPDAPFAGAVLAGADGQVRGTAEMTTTGGAMRLTVNATGLTPGVHGVHVHAVGQCDAPDFASAGGHWNPTMKQHGADNPMGAHEGDLPNLKVGADGKGTLSVAVMGTRGTLFDADGAAVVIHADPDDYRTDPSGKSGARIACGVLTAN